eukprot:5116209-Prymnesium_polylepis.1
MIRALGAVSRTRGLRRRRAHHGESGRAAHEFEAARRAAAQEGGASRGDELRCRASARRARFGGWGRRVTVEAKDRHAERPRVPLQLGPDLAKILRHARRHTIRRGRGHRAGAAPHTHLGVAVAVEEDEFRREPRAPEADGGDGVARVGREARSGRMLVLSGTRAIGRVEGERGHDGAHVRRAEGCTVVRPQDEVCRYSCTSLSGDDAAYEFTRGSAT